MKQSDLGQSGKLMSLMSQSLLHEEQSQVNLDDDNKLKHERIKSNDLRNNKDLWYYKPPNELRRSRRERQDPSFKFPEPPIQEPARPSQLSQ